MSRIHSDKKVVVFWDWTAFPQHAPEYKACEVILDPSPLAADEVVSDGSQGHHLPGAKGGGHTRARHFYSADSGQ